MNRFQFLWGYISRWKGKLLLSFLGMFFVSAISLAFPWLLKILVDQFSGTNTSPISSGDLILIMIVLLILSAVTGYRQYMTMQMLGSKLRNDIRADLYWSFLQQPLDFHIKQQVGELSSRVTEDVGKLQALFSGIFSPALQNSFVVAGCIFLMLILNWLAAIIILCIVIIPLLSLGIVSRRIKHHASEGQRLHAKSNALLEETLVAIKDIKAFVREKAEHSRYLAILSEALGKERKIFQFQAMTNQVMYLLLSTILLGIFYAGSKRTIFPSWTMGGVIAFYLYTYTFTMSLVAVGRVYLQYQGISGPLDRVIELLRMNETPDKSGSHTENQIGKIEFKDVSFEYEHGITVLERFNLTIEAGSWILITGPSGSGKSTLANLLMGFFKPLRGTIQINSTPLPDWDIRFFRENVGYIGQEPFLFHGTIRENIVLDRQNPSENDLNEVLNICCLEDVLNRLPEGIETIIGERGVSLSGGEKGRIALARALFKNPPILILDEALRSVESSLEKTIWNHLHTLRKNLTTIILSHHAENIPNIYHHLDIGSRKIIPKAM